ncbi:MAG: recombinase RecA [Deltaproteobacteria bacterium]|nr:recombinase RecA [Deltaproteobacteria bacterium]
MSQKENASVANRTSNDRSASTRSASNKFASIVKERFAALTHVLGGLEKQFGKGAIMLLGDDGAQQEIKSFPSGSLFLDRALGVGGYPCGRVVELFGPESSGKTTLSLHAIAEVQKKGGIAAFVDAEHALDVQYARTVGVDVERLVVSQPDSGEQALEMCEQLCRSGAVDLVVIDSVAALTPRAEIEGDMGDAHMGLQARLMSQALRKLTSVVAKTQCTVIFLNQLRQKIGVVFGNTEVTTGGNALKFYASIRLDIRRIQTLKDVTGPVGARTRVKVVKNKVSPPFGEAEFDLIFGRGICHEGELLDLGIEANVVEKSGAWWSMNDERLGQGRENARETLRENPEKMTWLENAVIEKLKIRGASSGDKNVVTKEKGSDCKTK